MYSVEILPRSLNKQLDADEKLFLKENHILLENIYALRKLAADQSWYDQHKGLMIGLYQGNVITTTPKSSFEILNSSAVQSVGASKVYIVHLDPMFINAAGDLDPSYSDPYQNAPMEVIYVNPRD